MSDGVGAARPGWLSVDQVRLDDLVEVVSERTDVGDYPYAASVQDNVLVYDGERVRSLRPRPGQPA